MLRPSELVKLRSSSANAATHVLRPGEAGFEAALEHQIRRPMYDAIETRIRWTPPDQIDNLVGALGDELRLRGRES